jgi:PAS domain S-box-containing protein
VPNFRLPEEHFRIAVEASPSGMLMVDRHGTILLVNRQIEQQFGYHRNQLIGQSIEILVPSRFRPMHLTDRERYMKLASARPMGKGRELYGLRNDGSEFPIEIGLNPVQTDEGTVVLASVVDITERKRAEEEFRVAVEASPNGMLMVDERGTILLMNAQIERQFGYSREELLGNSVHMLVPESLRAAHNAHCATFFDTAKPRQMGAGRELFGIRKDGQLISVEIGLNPIRMAAGMRVLASVVDISDRKRIEEQLRRTQLLAELGTLASGMAHEIGTPMNVILGRAEFAMRRIEDERAKQSLATIITQVERITKIMNQFLTFARRRPAERRPVGIKDIIEDSLEMLRERLARHRIQVVTNVPEHLPLVHADPDQMSQVLLNLFINALHAMPDGGTVTVTVTAEPATVAVRISDTGHGIPRENLGKIFTPFFTTKEVGKGTGLGLTVVHGIIEEHAGSIAVESELGKGTAFTLLLPTDRRA